MKKIIIVESKLDAAVLRHLIQLNPSKNESIDTIEDIVEYKELGGLSSGAITAKITEVLSNNLKEGFEKIAIIVDQDDISNDRHNLILTGLIKAIEKNSSYTIQEVVNDSKQLKVKLAPELEIAAFIVRKEHGGEMENILKASKNLSSEFADCTDALFQCTETKVLQFTEKEKLKIWLEYYLRYYQCERKLKSQSNTNCGSANIDKMLSRQSNLFDFQHIEFRDLIDFLNKF